MERFPEARINGEGARRLPGVINICVPGISAESLMMNLDMAGFAVSVGSACSSGSTEPSHVLEAMGHTLEDNHASVRFSLSHLNTPTELERLDAALADIAPRLFL
jgi:cysteine desulfurase